MNKLAISLFLVMASAAALAQAPAADTWSNAPTATDDRYTNPKSKVYAGPNGWWNFGEVRAVVNNPTKTKYEFKAGFTTNQQTFNLADSGKLRILTLDFGTDKPPAGNYDAAASANLAQKKVKVSLGDVSGGKIRDWSSEAKAGTVTVSIVNGFTYIKFRGITLVPSAVYNKGDLAFPVTAGFEGAVAP